MNQDFKRHTAYKVRICDLLNGEYVKRGGWEPSYFLLPQGKVSRINVVAIVVSVEEGNQFLIDDGTGNMLVRSFQDSPKVLPAVGDLVLIVGRPKEWGQTKYIVPEIVRKLENRQWLVVRQMEIKHLKEIIPKKEVPKHSPPKELGPYQRVLQIIDMLDKGDGASQDEVTLKSGLKDAQKIISKLLEEGEIFQVKPGKIKILD